MSRKGKNGARRRAQRRRFDHTIHPHTRPGTIIVPPDALPPLIQLTAYGPEQIVEKRNATTAQIRELRGKYPVLWIDVVGLGDPALIEEVGQVLGLHHLSLEDMSTVPQRSKVEDFPHHLFAVTQIPTYNGDLCLEQVSLFAGKGFVLSWREHEGSCFDIVRRRLQVTAGTTRSAGVDYLLYALIDAVNPDDEADVERTVAQIKACFATFPWMPSTIRDLLDGKTFLPDNKLRPNLLNPGTGFMGDGAYREHFFGRHSLPALLSKAAVDIYRYSDMGLALRRRTQARLAGQTNSMSLQK